MKTGHKKNVVDTLQWFEDPQTMRIGENSARITEAMMLVEYTYSPIVQRDINAYQLQSGLQMISRFANFPGWNIEKNVEHELSLLEGAFPDNPELVADEVMRIFDGLEMTKKAFHRVIAKNDTVDLDKIKEFTEIDCPSAVWPMEYCTEAYIESIQNAWQLAEAISPQGVDLLITKLQQAFAQQGLGLEVPLLKIAGGTEAHVETALERQLTIYREIAWDGWNVTVESRDS